jgi:hypothetical protein
MTPATNRRMATYGTTTVNSEVRPARSAPTHAINASAITAIREKTALIYNFLLY